MPSLRSQRGFTLVEMIVVIAILAMLSAMVVVNFRNTEKMNAVRLGAEQFVGALREAQNDALAQKRVGDPNKVPAGGFGVYVDKSVLSGDITFTLFADNGSALGKYDAADLILRPPPETLPRYSKFARIRVGDTTVDELSVIFKPPQGEVIFGNLGVVADSGVAAFVIQSTDPNVLAAKAVTVSPVTALIDINDQTLQSQ